MNRGIFYRGLKKKNPAGKSNRAEILYIFLTGVLITIVQIPPFFVIAVTNYLFCISGAIILVRQLSPEIWKQNGI